MQREQGFLVTAFQHGELNGLMISYCYFLTVYTIKVSLCQNNIYVDLPRAIHLTAGEMSI